MGKRYYWIRLKDDFFTSKEVKKLRRIAGGDTYTIIYLKMLILAAKTDGVLTWTGLEENYVEELALELDEKDVDVEVTLSFLLKSRLAETKDGIQFFLPYVMEVSGSESDSAERTRNYRARMKAAQSLGDGSASQCDTEKETIEETIEDAIDIKREDRKISGPPSLEDIKAFVFENGYSIDPNRFHTHYEGTGWITTAGNPITDWQEKVREWERTERKQPKRNKSFAELFGDDVNKKWNVHVDVVG